MSHIKAPGLWRNLRSTANKSLCSLGPCSTMSFKDSPLHFGEEFKTCSSLYLASDGKWGRYQACSGLSSPGGTQLMYPFILVGLQYFFVSFTTFRGLLLVFPKYSVDAATPNCNCQVIKFCLFSKACQQHSVHQRTSRT